MNIAKRLGIKIRYYRKAKKMTQEKLAEACGFHPTYIGQLERGEKTASVETLYRLSHGLKVSMSELLDDTDILSDNEGNAKAPMAIYRQLLSVPPEKQKTVYETIQNILNLAIK